MDRLFKLVLMLLSPIVFLILLEASTRIGWGLFREVHARTMSYEFVAAEVSDDLVGQLDRLNSKLAANGKLPLDRLFPDQEWKGGKESCVEALNSILREPARRRLFIDTYGPDARPKHHELSILLDHEGGGRFEEKRLVWLLMKNFLVQHYALASSVEDDIKNLAGWQPMYFLMDTLLYGRRPVAALRQPTYREPIPRKIPVNTTTVVVAGGSTAACRNVRC